MTRREIRDGLKSLDLLTPEEAREVRAAWTGELRVLPVERQTTGGLREGECRCALGVLGDELVRRGYAAWEGARLITLDGYGGLDKAAMELPPAVLGAVGLRRDQAEQIVRWNDAVLMDWPEIAARVDRWGKA